MKGIKEDTNKMKDIPCSCIERYCKNVQSYLQIQCNDYQNSSGIFYRNRTNVFKICMLCNYKRLQIAEAILKRTILEALCSLISKLYYKALVVK